MRRLIFAAAAAVALAPVAAGAAGDAERGKYLAAIMDCSGCHSGSLPEGGPDPARYLTGADIGFELPGLGIFWPPNLTSDPTGLGAWSDDEIVTAIRTGVRPDGRTLAPIMPWHSYAALTDEDAQNLVTFLRGLPHAAFQAHPPVADASQAHAPYFSLVVPK